MSMIDKAQMKEVWNAELIVWERERMRKRPYTVNQ